MTSTAFTSLTVGGTPFVPGAFRGLVREPIIGSRVIYVGSDAQQRAGDGVMTATTLFGSTGALAKLSGRTNKGDIIYILPGHTESVAEADAASAQGAASGFSIIGLGFGTQRPTFTWTVAGATWLLDTAGMELANCRCFLAGAHAAGSALTVAAPITVSAASCRMIGNEFWWGFDADQIVGTGIIVSSTDFEFIGNKAIALVAAVPTETFLRLTAADRAHIAYNYIVGPTAGTTVGVIKGLTTASKDLDVHDNYLHNNLASSTIAFSPLAASTGEFANNRFSVESGILPITASIGRWHNNYCVDTEGQAGALVGSASS